MVDGSSSTWALALFIALAALVAWLGHRERGVMQTLGKIILVGNIRAKPTVGFIIICLVY